MGFFGFGKRVKNQQFNYIPRYYDPAKVKLQERLDMNSTDQSPELSKMRIKDGFSRKSRGNAQLEKEMKLKANIRLIIILAALVVIVYLMLNSQAIQGMMESMESLNSPQ